MQKDNSKAKSDLKKRCFKFGLDVISLCDTLSNKRSIWVISDQLIRSSTSIGANLVDGSAASSKREYKRYFEVALRSANETKYWLSLLRELELKPNEKIENLLDEAKQLSNMLASGVLKLKGRK